jgi:hypothetical protein
MTTQRSRGAYWSRRASLHTDADAEGQELNVSEEEWRRRVEKRHAIIQSVKQVPAYQARLERRKLRARRLASLTPDPNDRHFSKRTWERMVAEWRKEVKADGESSSEEA